MKWKQKIEISIIIPVYGCKDCLFELYRKLTEVLSSSFSTYEIVLVDDCSKDKAWDLIKDISEKDSHIKALKLSRNFGQQIAIRAGLAECTGKWAVVMDCDLQDPPQEIIPLYQKALEGYDIVFAKRNEKQHSLFRKAFSGFFFKLMNLTGEKATTFDSSFGGFSIISRKVIDSFLKFREQGSHYLFTLRWLGFRSTSIEYKHSSRYCGSSSYTFLNLLRLCIDGICSQTTTFLKLIIAIGFIVSSIGFSLSVFYIFRYFLYSSVSGWTSLITTILFMSGIIITSIGIVGIYIGKIFEQVKGRPLYVLDEIVNSDIGNSK